MTVSPGSQSQGTGLDCFTSWYLSPSVVDKPAMSYDYNLLILRSTGHARHFGGAQLQPGVPGGWPASTCLGIGIWSSGGCHASTCLGIRGPRWSTCLHLPKDPILGRPTFLDLLRDSIFRRLSCLNLPGEAQLSGCNSRLDRISFRKTHP